MNNNKQQGEETMNESYKDKFNAQMKKAGIDSLNDLKTDAEKKAFFKAVDKSHDAVDETVEKHDCDKVHPDVSHEAWSEKSEENVEEKNKESYLPPVKRPVAKRSNTRTGLSAAYESKKYHDTKPGSIQDSVMQMQADETKGVTIRVDKLSALIETYLARGGVSHNLSPLMTEEKLSEVLPLQAVREFIDTYNRFFLTNYKTEEFIVRDRLTEGEIEAKNKPGEMTIAKDGEVKIIKTKDWSSHQAKGWSKAHAAWGK